MHNRQLGAAHVPIMFFLLLLVMFLGAVAFAFVTQTRNGELIKERNTAILESQKLQRRDLLIQHYIADVGDVIRKPGKYEGRKGSGGAYDGATIEYEGIVNPEELKKVLDEACTRAEISVASGIENVVSSLVTRIGQLNERAKTAEASLDKTLTEKQKVDASFQAATTEATAKANEYSQNLEQARRDYDAAKTEQTNRINQANEALRAKVEELGTEKERATAKEKELAARISTHQMQNSALVERARLQKAPDVADGKILVAQNGVTSAFINLGRKDLLQPGTVFRVRNPNSAAVKGYATVVRVEEERSEVSLSNFVDPVGEYARAGDLLYNEFYTPRVTRTIYLMGRFSAPYHKPELANLLKRLGNKVVDKMQPGVDTVILGNNPVNEAGDGFSAVEESAEFKLASELRVEFAYLATIRDLIKL